MKLHFVSSCFVIFILSLVLVGATQAQAPEPGSPIRLGYQSPQPDAFSLMDEGEPFTKRQTATGRLAGTAAPAIALGQPGLSFRYVRTFGETRVPYLADTAHLHLPYGVAVSDDRLWIAESEGLRALQFTTAGAFVSQIGRGGIHDVFEYGASIDYPSDAAVAPNGNVWLVNKWANTLLEFDSSGKYLQEVGVRWNCVSNTTGFCAPTGIAFDAFGNRFVSDSDNHRIQVFNSSGIYQTTLGVTGMAGSDNSHLNNPEHIAIYDGLLYVADSRNHRVQIFNIAIPGMYVYEGTIGSAAQGGSGPGQLQWPAGVAVDTNYIYVADSDNHRVSIYQRMTRAHAATLGTGWGTGSMEFKNPRDVAVDAAGNIYVADLNNCRVQQFDSNQNYVRTYGTTGVPYVTNGDHYYHPFGVAAGPDGSLYILEERSSHRLVKLNSEGVYQWSIGEPGIAGGWNIGYNAHFSWPGDVSVDGAGRVYVADTGNDRVQIYDAAGHYVATLGTWGTGNMQFWSPKGLFSTADGALYVAEYRNHRVQIFDSAHQYVATLGVTGEPGADNAHFNRPTDVAVDSRGMIYVADWGNRRVQVFDAQRRYVRTIGVTGQGGRDYDHLDDPNKLAVDAQDRLYVADGWSQRVLVYDTNGAFLTMIGGSDGVRTGDLRGAMGVAVDGDGAVYITNYWDNARIQKFAPGVPGWRQVNINGFGRPWNSIILSLAPFGGQLYAGSYDNSGKGAQIWRMNTGGDWQQVMNGGFGDTMNAGIDHIAEFKGALYAGTWNANLATGASDGGQIWRSADGKNWSKVVDAGFGDPINVEVFRLAVFGDQLYAGTYGDPVVHGGEIWRSSTGDSGSWTRIANSGFNGDANNGITAFEVFDGFLYAGTYNAVTGGEIWRSNNGTTWNQVNADGFGTTNNRAISALAAFNGRLYASTYVKSGAGGIQVWRCQVCDGTDWAKTVENGFGNANTRLSSGLEVANDWLNLVVGNSMTGLEIWRTTTGDSSSWEQIGAAGLGDSNNIQSYWDNSLTVVDNRLFLGTNNSANGGEIWLKTLTADFTATPTRGAPPLAVQFTNTSAGDFTLSEWNFGDGVTSTMKVPTHTYTMPGVYTVTLTVSNQMDMSTVTKPAYIDVHQRIFLPLVLRNYDPLLYDNFDDPAWDGAWNPAKWRFGGNNTFQARQQGGALMFTNTTFGSADGADLIAQQPPQRTLAQLQVFEARLRVDHDHTGGYAFVKIQIAGDVAGHGWWTQCRLGAFAPGAQPRFICDMATHGGGSTNFEYQTASVVVNYDTWYKARIEADPKTANFRFYLGDLSVGGHIAADAPALIAASNLRPQVGVWNDAPNTAATRYVDDVRITPAR